MKTYQVIFLKKKVTGVFRNQAGGMQGCMPTPEMFFAASPAERNDKLEYESHFYHIFNFSIFSNFPLHSPTFYLFPFLSKAMGVGGGGTKNP